METLQAVAPQVSNAPRQDKAPASGLGMRQAQNRQVRHVPAGREYLTFRLGTEEYGIDILKVQEIRSYEQPTKIANAPAYLKGVVNLRGVIVPIVDLRVKFNCVRDDGQSDIDSFTVVIVLNVKGRVVGAVVATAGGEVTIHARKAVVLAAGGFPNDIERRKALFPRTPTGHEHLALPPLGASGDGLRLGESVGARVADDLHCAVAWAPVSKVPYKDGSFGHFPHIIERAKPGIIGVLANGRRFTNESNSYHDVGAAMVRACEGQKETAMWLVCDKATLAKYGIGFVKPAPMPIGKFLRNGYLVKGNTLAELAKNAGIDPAGLEQTVREYNVGAVKGEDPAFGRGRTSFNRYLADPANQPNPCVAPVQTGPFYAVKLIMGDLGTFDGIKTSVVGEVLKRDGRPIAGLYAVGNDRASIMGGNYPGAGITHGPNMTFGYVTGNHLADRAGAAA